MSVRIRKLYADLVTEAGAVCVVYVTRIEMARFRTTFAGVELYLPDGEREVLRASPPHAAELFEPRAGEVGIRLDLPQGPFELRYRNAGEPWRPSGGDPARGLRWSVVSPRADAVATWVTGSHRRRLEGLGYADLVTIDRLPRWLGLASLEWGRLHLPQETVVFTSVARRSGEEWKRLAVWSGNERQPRELRGFRVCLRRDVAGDRASYELDFVAPGRPRLLAVERELHRGPALDRARLPSRGERAVTGLLTGRVHEVRYISRTHGPVESERGWALHERVRFGVRRSRQRTRQSGVRA